MAIGDTNSSTVQSLDSREGDDAAPRQRFATVGRVWRATLDAVLPPLCLSCQVQVLNHDALCPACWRQIDFIRPPLCDRLGVPLPYDIGGTMISAAAAADPPPYMRARAVARYDSVMRRLIHDFKFRDTHDGRRLFGRWLTQAGAELLTECDAIIPVPLARWRLLGRRFNQSQILAAEVARIAGKPVLPLALKRHKSTTRQVGLTRLQRQQNVASAFSLAPSAGAAVANRSILLIDDVITTGATVSAASKTLLKAGATRVDVLALALVTETV